MCNINQACSLLFDSVSPTLIASGRLDELVALAFTMFYAPCLEGNSKWLREGCHVYFKIKGVKAEKDRPLLKLDTSAQRSQTV